MTQEEEFEFQFQLEREQAAAAEQPTTARGALSEINKAIGRGALGMVNAAGTGLGTMVAAPPLTTSTGRRIPLTPEADERMTTLRNTINERLKATPANKTEQMLGTGFELGTAMLPFTGGAASIPAKVMGLAAPIAGGVSGEQVAQDRGYNPEQGKLLGTFAGPLGMAAAGRALAPSVAPELKALVDSGWNPTVGEQTGGFLRKFESYPIVREIVSSAKGRSINSYGTAVNNIALAPLGAKIDGKGLNGMQKFEKADRIASQAYDDILPQLKIQYDPQFSREMTLQRSVAPRAIRQDLEDMFNTQIIANLEKDGRTILPAKMKEIDAELGREARRFTRDPAINSQRMADGIREMQGSLRDMVARQNPTQAGQLQRINAAWNNLVRVGDAVERAAATNGNFTPAQFQQSVKKMDSSLKHKAFKTGRAAMQGPASAGVEATGGDVAHVPYGALANVARYGAAGGAAAGTTAAAAATGTLPFLLGGAATFGSMYTPAGQALMRGAISGQRPMAAQTLGQMMREAPSYAPATLPLFTDFMREKQGQ